MNKIIRQRIYLSAMILIPIFLYGCAYNMGNKQITDKSLISQIKIGETNKEKVRSLLGDPMNVTFTDDKETWTYVYQKTNIRATSFIPLVGLFAGGHDTKMNNLTIVFREDGIVKSVGSGSTTGGGGGLQDLHN